MTDGIRIILVVPAHSLRRQIRVHPSTTIQEIKTYLPNPNCDILLGGCILHEQSSLESYSISNGAMLIAIATGAVHAQERWARMSSDQSAFEERMALLLNPKIAPEKARLRDLLLARLGQKPGVIAKLWAYYKEGEGCFKADAKTVVGDPPSGPSCDPLPVPWNISTSA
jgi:hypothetical protein